MRLSKNIVALLFVLLLAVSAAAQKKPAGSNSFLPPAFAGWEMQGTPQTGTDTAAVDPAQGKVLREYGFTDFETATYVRPDRKLTVKAARFQDASGAYGAFTFYRMPQMLSEKVGTMATSLNDRVLFFRDNILVQAQFDRVTAMSAAELRDLAASLPSAQGTAANLPPLPGYFPRDQVVPNSAKYILGPEALAAVGASVPASLVDFSRDAEVMLGTYAADGKTAEVMLIMYPTPQIAGERLTAIESAVGQPGEGSSFAAKRTGPIVALVKGGVPQSEAKSLLARVAYEADVTWNENAGNSKRDNIGNLVIAASILAGVIFLFSVVSGAIFGFARVLMRRFFPQRYTAGGDEAEFIRLNLKN